MPCHGTARWYDREGDGIGGKRKGSDDRKYAGAVDKERAFLAIFSTMIGAIEIARMLPHPAVREQVLGSARDFLSRSF